jgi:hypothetical protein
LGLTPNVSTFGNFFTTLFLTLTLTKMQKKFNLDLDKGRIEFIDSRFYKTPNGFVPSVTTILEAFPKDASYFKWLKDVGKDADEIRDEAGRRGSIVHELTEQYDIGEECTFVSKNGNPQYKMLEWSMFERYVDFSTTHNPEIMALEMHFASDDNGYAGTLDRIIKLNGKFVLLDIKTSNAIYPSYWLQLAAYYALYSEVYPDPIDEVAILWLNAKTRTNGKNGAIQGHGWQLITKSMEELKDDYTLFLATHKLWLSMNKDIKPKQLSYQISHKK